MSKNKYPTQGGVLILARPTGFEPAISSVTGRRDRPASLRAHIASRMIAVLTPIINTRQRFIFTGPNGIMIRAAMCRCSSAGRAALS